MHERNNLKLTLGFYRLLNAEKVQRMRQRGAREVRIVPPHFPPTLMTNQSMCACTLTQLPKVVVFAWAPKAFSSSAIIDGRLSKTLGPTAFHPSAWMRSDRDLQLPPQRSAAHGWRAEASATVSLSTSPPLIAP
jgi:hypothetical protein